MYGRASARASTQMLVALLYSAVGEPSSLSDTAASARACASAACARAGQHCQSCPAIGSAPVGDVPEPVERRRDDDDGDGGGGDDDDFLCGGLGWRLEFGVRTEGSIDRPNRSAWTDNFVLVQPENVYSDAFFLDLLLHHEFSAVSAQMLQTYPPCPRFVKMEIVQFWDNRIHGKTWDVVWLHGTFQKTSTSIGDTVMWIVLGFGSPKFQNLDPGNYEMQMWIEANNGSSIAKRTQHFRVVRDRERLGPLATEPPSELLADWMTTFSTEERLLRMAAMRQHIDSGAVFEQTFLGYRTLRFAQDAWLIQELMAKVQPECFIELGTSYGGGALYWASHLELIDPRQSDDGAKVITVDILDTPTQTCRRNHGSTTCLADISRHPLWTKRVVHLGGRSSTDAEVLTKVQSYCTGRRTMLLIDSLHTHEHVLAELHLYSGLVSAGSYMIIEDTSNHFASLDKEQWLKKGTVLSAVLEFMQQPQYIDHFVWAKNVENRLFFTNNPMGYHKRVV